MSFINTTTSKLLTLCVIGVFSCISVQAQLNTNSPYSTYGIGNLRSSGFVMNNSLGGVGYGLTTPFRINNQNPASYGFLRYTAFEAGAEQNNEWLISADQTEYNPQGALRYLAFGFPIAKYWGLSFGIMPVSNVGYYFDKADSSAVLGRVDNIYLGSGGLNKVYIGNGFKINVDSSMQVAFGFNANYIFGDIYHEQRVIFRNVANAFHTWYFDEVYVSDFTFDAGFQVKKRFCASKDENGNCERKGIELGLGVVYGLQNDLSSTLTRLGRTYSGNIGFETIKDTALSIADSSVNTAMPQTLGVGFSIGKPEKLMLMTDYQLQNWGDVNQGDSVLTNSSRLSAGIQYTPDHEAWNNYLKVIHYRIGMRYQQSNISLNNNQLTDFGITFGVGLPFRKTTSTLNLGVVAGQRGTIENNLIKEQYVNFSIGVTLNDLWFYKRKYD